MRKHRGMIYISNNGFVRMTRGDSFDVPLFIDRGTMCAPVRFYIKDHPESTVYLGVMEPNQDFENAIIRKKYTSTSLQNEYGDLIISFCPQDTQCLLPGKYYYSFKIQTNTRVDTIIPKTEFFIMD